MAKSDTKEKQKPNKTLGVNDPESSYVSPDLSFHEGTGQIPDEEREWHEARNERQQEEVEAANKSEDEVAERRRKEQEKEGKEREREAKEAEKQAPPKKQ